LELTFHPYFDEFTIANPFSASPSFFTGIKKEGQNKEISTP
jgi:hypothetical protein